jgi:hypothetical protein
MPVGFAIALALGFAVAFALGLATGFDVAANVEVALWADTNEAMMAITAKDFEVLFIRQE